MFHPRSTANLRALGFDPPLRNPSPPPELPSIETETLLDELPQHEEDATSMFVTKQTDSAVLEGPKPSNAPNTEYDELIFHPEIQGQIIMIRNAKNEHQTNKTLKDVVSGMRPGSHGTLSSRETPKSVSKQESVPLRIQMSKSFMMGSLVVESRV